MPQYTYKCQICDDITTRYNHISNRHNDEICECGGSCKLSIQPTQLQPVLGGGEFQGYQCPVTDEYVTSRVRRRDIMREHDLVEKG